MSFCSYEEAWGSPYESNQNNDHVKKSNDDEQKVISNVIRNNESAPDDSKNGMVETAPLRGSLLGGAIPSEQWTTQEPKRADPVTLESRFDTKIDQLINTLDKYTNSMAQASRSEDTSTTWTDVLVFIALGVVAIFVLDMFFKFGKWIVTSQMSAAANGPHVSTPLSHMTQAHQMTPVQQHYVETDIPQPRYHYSHSSSHSSSPPSHSNVNNFRRPMSYYPKPGPAPPRGM